MLRKQKGVKLTLLGEGRTVQRRLTEASELLFDSFPWGWAWATSSHFSLQGFSVSSSAIRKNDTEEPKKK